MSRTLREERWGADGHLEGRIGGSGPWEILATQLQLVETPSIDAFLMATRHNFRQRAKEAAESWKVER